ncbi:hypothetical protein ACMFWY_10070 [Roseiconus sp. JC912]|uniref:hypothetical protein n=1 Tax=Roseiconus sp. JC912 TaxID=3396307 RepID=UPI003A4C5CDF
MNIERLQLLESLFREAVDLDEGSVDALLNERCGDDLSLKRSVLSLLTRDRDLENSQYLAAPPHGTVRSDAESICGTYCGAFKLVRHLGSGGMGDVFLGVRDDEFKQQAAIKIVRTGFGGEKVVRRFDKRCSSLLRSGNTPTSPASLTPEPLSTGNSISRWSLSMACRSTTIVTTTE